MLINTKHIVMYDEVVNDFSRIANMVDDDGAVLILRDGKPAYAVVSFDDVQEDERPKSQSPQSETPQPDEAKCGCGRPMSKCNCGGPEGHHHGGHGHGGHGHGPHHAGGPQGPHSFGPQSHGQYFGHGSDAGHVHESPWEEEPSRAYTRPVDGESESEWDFSFHSGPGFDPLFRGGPDFSIDEFIGKVPPELLDAGRRFVNQLSPLIGLFGGANATNVTPTDSPDSDK